MALVEVIGHLIREIAVSADLTNDSDKAEKQLNGLYDLLLERTLDLSSYVRTKVLSTLAKLCDLPVKFPKQRLQITRAAVESLEDKATSVRKVAIALLVKLIVTHPYGLMHGGLLGLQEWEKRYQEVCDEASKLEAEVRKAVQGQNGESSQTDGDDEEKGEDDDEDDEDEEDDDEAASPRPKKRYATIC